MSYENGSVATETLEIGMKYANGTILQEWVKNTLGWSQGSHLSLGRAVNDLVRMVLSIVLFF